jgi:hypothetical protein
VIVSLAADGGTSGFIDLVLHTERLSVDRCDLLPPQSHGSESCVCVVFSECGVTTVGWPVPGSCRMFVYAPRSGRNTDISCVPTTLF